MADASVSPDQKVPVYFIGVDYPADIGTLNYTVRGKSYQVPRNAETGAPDIGAALMADPNDIQELISKARYFNGKVNVEVFTTDQTIAAAVKKAYAKGTKTPIEARLVGSGTDIIVAPSKEEILSMMSNDELIALLKSRGQELPENLSDAKFAPNADESANARGAAVTAAQKRAEAKRQAEAEVAAKLEA